MSRFFKQYATVLCLLCFVSITVSSAQEVLYSNFEKFDIRKDDYAIIGNVNNRVYTYRATADGYFLDAYNNSDMSKVATVILDFFPQKIYATQFYAVGEKIFVFYQSLEKTKLTQWAAILNEKGMLIKKPVNLGNAQTGFLGPTKDYFSYAISEDKKQFVIYTLNVKRDKLSFNGVWINDTLGISEKSAALFQSENDLSGGDVILTNSGTVYINAYTTIGNKGYSDEMWLLSIKGGSKKFNIIECPLQNIFAANSYLKADNRDNKLYLSGFYSNNKKGDFDGVLFSALDLGSESFATYKTLPFSDNRAYSEGNKSTFNDFVVRNIILNNEGGFVLIAEKYKFIMRSSPYSSGWGYYSMYSSPFMNTSIREFYYRDIMLLSYNGNGERLWSSFIPKNQYSQEDGGIFSSFSTVNSGGSLGFLFNDYNGDNSRIQLATVDSEGKGITNALNIGNIQADWMPRFGKQTGSKEIIIPCVYKKQFCYAKVVF